MMTPRETWTDQRLDDLNKKVDAGFAKVDERFKQVDERFKQVDERFNEVNGRLDRFETRMDNDIRELRRMVIQGFFAMTTIMLTGFAALVAAMLV